VFCASLPWIIFAIYIFYFENVLNTKLGSFMVGVSKKGKGHHHFKKYFLHRAHIKDKLK